MKTMTIAKTEMTIAKTTKWTDIAIRRSLRYSSAPTINYLETRPFFTPLFSTHIILFNAFLNKKMEKENEADKKTGIKKWLNIQKTFRPQSEEEKRCAGRATLLLVESLNLLSNRQHISNVLKSLIVKTCVTDYLAA